MKIRLSAAARKAAKTLAVSYMAYYDARREQDDNGIVVWGEILRRTQAELGIGLNGDAQLETRINEARERETKRKESK